VEKKEQHPALGKAPRKRPPRLLAVIDQRGCTGCDSCIPVCPVDCIETVPGPDYPDFMKLVEVDYERCIGCSACAQICPWETIFMLGHDEGYAHVSELTLRSVLYKELGENAEKPPEDQS